MSINLNSIDEINSNYEKAVSLIESCSSLSQLEEVRVETIGRKSFLNNILKSIKDLSPDERKEVGSRANFIRKDLENKIDLKSKELFLSDITKSLKENVDITQPGKEFVLGHNHPIEIARRKAEKIFQSLGFSIEESPELETDYYNFDGLNVPPNHPARDLWDTFWTDDNLIPRTHASSFQQRMLEKYKNDPNIRAINFGRCFRNEATDARHEFTFYQIDGFVIDQKSTIKDLTYTLKTFFSLFYEKEINIQIQPSYFPFVEPGLQMLSTCISCEGSNPTCPLCSGSGWIEVLGCGMVHPNVLLKAGIDPEKYQGYAWGMGLDRLVLIKYGIDDIRKFNDADLKFIHQF